MQVYKSLKYFYAPSFNDFKSRIFDLLYILSQATSSDHFSNEDYLLSFLIEPG